MGRRLASAQLPTQDHDPCPRQPLADTPRRTHRIAEGRQPAAFNPDFLRMRPVDTRMHFYAREFGLPPNFTRTWCKFYSFNDKACQAADACTRRHECLQCGKNHPTCQHDFNCNVD